MPFTLDFIPKISAISTLIPNNESSQSNNFINNFNAPMINQSSLNHNSNSMSYTKNSSMMNIPINSSKNLTNTNISSGNLNSTTNKKISSSNQNILNSSNNFSTDIDSIKNTLLNKLNEIRNESKPNNTNIDINYVNA